MILFTLVNIALLGGSIQAYRAARKHANGAHESAIAAGRFMNRAESVNNIPLTPTPNPASIPAPIVSVQSDSLVQEIKTYAEKAKEHSIRSFEHAERSIAAASMAKIHAMKAEEHATKTQLLAPMHEICSKCTKLVARFETIDGQIICANCKS
jgi:hypothetical protein